MTLPFHPIVAGWFTETLGEPLPAQERAWAAIREGRHTLLAAPTGSGKTLAAFLNAIDELLRDGLEHGLENEVRVLYISPLKALSADIHKNLEEPLGAIRERAVQAGLPSVRIRSAVRTGDTPSSRRAAMLRTPPHILVTTPESLYLLLTAERSRAMLRTVRTVIVDEIHAVIDSRRGLAPGAQPGAARARDGAVRCSASGYPPPRTRSGRSRASCSGARAGTRRLIRSAAPSSMRGTGGPWIWRSRCRLRPWKR